jgi:ligand-binding sensor domain-containing protein
MASNRERVYAGTLGRGLWVYQHRTGRWSEIADGLPSHNVTALALADGYLYVGTDNGLLRIREAQLIEP